MIETQNTVEGDLLAALKRFELIARATHDVLWDWDLEKETVWWSEGFEQMFGEKPDVLETGPDSWYNRIHPEDQERVLTKVHRAIESGDTNWSDKYRFRRANGTYAHVHDRGYMIKEGDKAVRMLGSMMDLTEQINSETALRNSEQSLRFAMEAAGLGTWDMDPVSKTLTFNDKCRELFGNPKNEVLHYETLLQHIHFQDRDRVKEAVENALNPAIRSNYNVRYRTIGATDKVIRWLHCKGQANFDETGRAVRFAGITREVTEEVQNEEKVIWADQQAAMTIESSGAGSFLVNLTTNEIIYSPTMAFILTGSEEEHISRSVFVDHLHPADFNTRNAAYQEAARTGNLNYEARFIWNDGSTHWVRVIGKYLYDQAGSPVSLSGIVMDVTDRIEAEQRLKTSEEHLRTLIEQAPVATSLYVGKEMVIEMANEAMLKLWGKGNSVIGKPLHIALPELDGQAFLGILDEIYETGESHSEQGARGDIEINGVLQTFYYDYTYKPLRNADGDIYAIMNMAADVTEQVKSRIALEKSEDRYRQLAAELERRVQQRTAELNQTNSELINSNNNLQQFAYAASHDMQEPLRKIQSFGSRLKSVYADKLDENGAHMLNRIQDASKRMSVMIDDLLAYSRLATRESEFSDVDMNALVSAVLTDLEISIQEQKTSIILEDIPTVWGNTSQLTQLIQNLVSNAIKYRKPDAPSDIKISARAVSEVEKETIPKLLPDQDYICLTIADNGIGFDEIHLDRIFQMFQRLHGRSEFSGSGIGLALCKKVVQNHHGHITAKSEPGNGSTFIVYLPQPA